MEVKLVGYTRYQASLFGANDLAPEQLLIAMARVSSDKPMEERGENIEGLLRYCIENGHWSIFETVNIVLYIKTSLAVATQLLRHRSFTFQMFSQRYQEVRAIDLRKGRGRKNTDEPILDKDLEALANSCIQNSIELYHTLLSSGVSRETARMVLPVSVPTELFMNGTVRSWLHYLKVRLDSHTQKEHRELAMEIYKVIENLLPITFNIYFNNE